VRLEREERREIFVISGVRGREEEREREREGGGGVCDTVGCMSGG